MSLNPFSPGSGSSGVGGSVGSHQSNSTSNPTSVTAPNSFQGSGPAGAQTVTGTAGDIAPAENSGTSIQNNTGTIKLTSTDYGAISGGLAFANNALLAASSALGSAFQQSQSVIDKTPISDSGAVSQSLTTIALIAGGVVALVVLAKK